MKRGKDVSALIDQLKTCGGLSDILGFIKSCENEEPNDNENDIKDAHYGHERRKV